MSPRPLGADWLAVPRVQDGQAKTRPRYFELSCMKIAAQVCCVR